MVKLTTEEKFKLLLLMCNYVRKYGFQYQKLKLVSNINTVSYSFIDKDTGYDDNWERCVRAIKDFWDTSGEVKSLFKSKGLCIQYYSPFLNDIYNQMKTIVPLQNIVMFNQQIKSGI